MFETKDADKKIPAFYIQHTFSRTSEIFRNN